MADANEFVQAVKKASLEAQESTKPVNIYFGTVRSASPLKIPVEQKMLLGERQLVLSRNVTDFVTTISVNWETQEKGGGSGEGAYEEHKHRISGQKQITVHNGLKTGDEVILIRQQKGQKFVVMDRTGGRS